MKKIKKFLRNFSIYNDISLYIFKKAYTKKNKNNYTTPGKRFNLNHVIVGDYSYGEINAWEFGNPNEFLSIGKFCSIAPNVNFILSGEHNYKTILSYPINQKFYGIDEAICRGKIIVEDDVWIGFGTTILSGVTIGKGSIVGANSIVNKDIPPYSIYVGNRIVKRRFSEKIINELIELDYKNIDKDLINKYKELYEKNIDDEIINKIKETL